MKVKEEYMQWCFRQCARDGSEYLTVDGLDYVAHLAGSIHTNDELRKYAMDLMDKDGGGRVSYDEFREFMESRPDPRQNLWDAFKIIDENGDGYIDRLELTDIICRNGTNDAEEVQRVLEQFDTDKDGRLNIAEFIELMIHTLDDQKE